MPGRNTGAHFSEAPQSSIRKSKMPIKFTHKTTYNAGDLVPIFVQEVLPGDTFKIEMDSLVRLATPIHPTMDNLYQDTYFFFVPNRLVWDHWQEFNGENNQAWYQDTTQFIPPYFAYGATGTEAYYVSCFQGSVLNYLGLPVFDRTGKKEFKATALDFNAYCKIFNDWFRDENLQDEVPIYKGDGIIPATYWNAYGTYLSNNFGLSNMAPDATGSTLKVAKFHDYFTSALPAPQKGPDVLIPAAGTISLKDDWYDANKQPGFEGYSSGNYYDDLSLVGNNNNGQFNDALYQNNGGLRGRTTDFYGIPLAYDPKGTLTYDGLQITVNNLRLARQTQKLLERDARGGTRYIELIKAHFGVTSPDGRLQRSEYLGGKRTLLNMAEVIQTSESGTTPQGNLAGRSATATHENGFTKSFTEHGYIIGLTCVRTQRTYSQGLPKRYSRFDRLEYYLPVMANIGEQPILNKEIYLTDTTENNVNPDDVFGYQEAWAEYRYTPDRVSGYFAPGITGTLDSWHYGDLYTSTPHLSSQWLAQGPNEVDRTISVTSATTHQFIADFYFHGSMTRPMPVYSVPGLVDHN